MGLMQWIDAMLNKIAFSYFRSAFFHQHLSLHKYRHYHSCLSVKQALESDPSRSIPVLIQVGRVKPMFDCFLFVYHWHSYPSNHVISHGENGSRPQGPFYPRNNTKIRLYKTQNSCIIVLRFPMPWRSALQSYATSWLDEKLSKWF